MLEQVLSVAASAISSYSRTISRKYSPSTWRSLVSKQNSRSGLFKAFYRSLDQRSRLSLRPSTFGTVGAAYSGPLLATGGPDTYPAHSNCSRSLTRKQIPAELQSAYPAYIRGASTRARWLKCTRCTIAETHTKFATVTLENGNMIYHCALHLRRWREWSEGGKRDGEEFNIASRTA